MEKEEINHFAKVPVDKQSRNAVDNIFRLNHVNQTRLSIMADAKANIMITVASVVFSIAIANLDNELMRWPLLTFALLLGISGVQLFCFGLLGELQIRTYHESQGRPIYRIRTTLRGGRRGSSS